MTGLIIDLFAGGGGASVGIEAALGRPVVAEAIVRANVPARGVMVA